MIILAVQGSGKSYAAGLRNDVADIDRIRGKEELSDYIARLYAAEDNPDIKYVLGNARYDIAKKILEDGKDIVIFAPFKDLMDEKGYRNMKERIFGRLVLRREQNQFNYGYIEDFKKGYDLYNDTAYYKDLKNLPGKVTFFPMCSQIDSVSELIGSGLL